MMYLDLNLTLLTVYLSCLCPFESSHFGLTIHRKEHSFILLAVTRISTHTPLTCLSVTRTWHLYVLLTQREGLGTLAALSCFLVDILVPCILVPNIFTPQDTITSLLVIHSGIGNLLLARRLPSGFPSCGAIGANLSDLITGNTFVPPSRRVF